MSETAIDYEKADAMIIKFADNSLLRFCAMTIEKGNFTEEQAKALRVYNSCENVTIVFAPSGMYPHDVCYISKDEAQEMINKGITP